MTILDLFNFNSYLSMTFSSSRMDSRVPIKIVMPIVYALICLSVEEVTVRAGCEVLGQVDDNREWIVGNP